VLLWLGWLALIARLRWLNAAERNHVLRHHIPNSLLVALLTSPVHLAAKVWRYQLSPDNIAACRQGVLDDQTVEFVCVDSETNELAEEIECVDKPSGGELTESLCHIYAYDPEEKNCASLFVYDSENAGWNLDEPQCQNLFSIGEDEPTTSSCSALTLEVEVGGTNYPMYRPGPAFSAEKAEEICIVFAGAVPPEEDDCTQPKHGGQCQFVGQGEQEFKYTVGGNTTTEDTSSHCQLLKDYAYYSFEGRNVCSGTLAWKEFCEADFLANPAGFYNTDKVVKCVLERDSDSAVHLNDEKFCTLNLSSKPAPTTQCTGQDIPESDFAVEPSCPDLFSEAIDDSVTEGTERCLVQKGEAKHYINKEEGMNCTSQTLGACLERVVKFAAVNPCTSPLESYHRVNGTEGDAEVKVPHIPALPPAVGDYQVLINAELTPCEPSKYNNTHDSCVGRWNATTRSFNGAVACGWQNAENVLEPAASDFCVAVFDSTPQPCEIRKLPVEGARLSTCEELFDGETDLSQGKTPQCLVLASDNGWYALIETDGPPPVQCHNADMVSPASCADPDIQGTDSCEALATATCYIVGTSKTKQFSNATPCDDALRTAIIAQVQGCQNASDYVVGKETPNCDYDPETGTFKEGSVVVGECQLGETRVPAQFCSKNVTDTPGLFEDVDTNENTILRDCKPTDVLKWSDNCSHIFTGEKVVYKEDAFGPACVYTDLANVTHPLPDNVCTAELSGDKPAGKTIAQCGATFNNGGFDDINCKAESEGVALVATCKVNDVLIVKEDGTTHDFTACQNDYNDFVFNSPSCEGNYEYGAVCTADPTADDFEETDKVTSCQYDGDDADVRFCQARGLSPSGEDATKCKYSELPNSKFVPVVDVKCTDVFTENETDPNAKRCLVIGTNNTKPLDAAKNSFCDAKALTLVSCVERTVTYPSGICVAKPTVAVALKNDEGDPLPIADLEILLDEDFDFTKGELATNCNLTLLTDLETNCNGKYIDNTEKFGSATTCAYDGELADPRYCQVNFLEPPKNCELKFLSGSSAIRPSTCAELFPTGNSTAGAQTEECHVYTVNGAWVTVSLDNLDPADVPAACASLGTKSPSQCVEAVFEGQGTCTALQINVEQCNVEGTQTAWDDAALCDDAKAAARRARVQNASCTGDYAAVLANNGTSECAWNKDTNAFDPTKKAKYDCTYEGEPADPEFCSSTTGDATPSFDDIVDGKVLKDCQLKDFVAWSTDCVDIFKSKDKIVFNGNYPAVCRAEVQSEVFYPGDEACPDDTKPATNVTIETCGGEPPVFTFQAPDTTTGAVFDCKSYNQTDLSGTTAACTAFDTPIVDDEDKPEFTKCKTLPAYVDYVLSTDQCDTNKYAWNYVCDVDIGVAGFEAFKQGLTTTTCSYDGDTADDAFCSTRLQAPNTNTGDNCKLSDVSADRFEVSPTCSQIFGADDSEPTASYCLVKSADGNSTQRVPTGGDDTNAACENNKQVLSSCVEKKVFVDDNNPCTAPITRKCVIKDTDTVANEAIECDALESSDWTYATAPHFADKGCDAEQLTKNNTLCDSRFVSFEAGFEAGATNCAYDDTVVPAEFCNNNGKSGAGACTLKMLSDAFVSGVQCHLLYPEDDSNSGYVASNEDVPGKCFVKTKQGDWVGITAEEAASLNLELPDLCDALPATSRDNCTQIVAPSTANCTDIGLADSSCVVSGTNIKFLDAASDTTCQTKLRALRMTRAEAQKSACVDESHVYTLKSYGEAQCYAKVEGEAPEENYLSTRTAEPDPAGSKKLCYYGAGDEQDQPASIEYCSQEDDLSDVVDDGENPPFISGDCTLAECGLAWKTDKCGLHPDRPVKVLYSSCVVRIADGSSVEIDPEYCLDNLPAAEATKFACNAVQVQWVNRADEMKCSTDADPAQETVTPVLKCAVKTTEDNKWYVMTNETDTAVHDSYWKRCDELEEKPGNVTDTPSLCVAEAKWTAAAACAGTYVESRTFACTGAAESVCTDVLGDLGKDVPRCYAAEKDYYDWYAKRTGTCTPCSTTGVEWVCKKTTNLRLERQPLDPMAVKIRFDDSDLDGQETVDDDLCDSKPNFDKWPCSCDTTPIDALVYNGVANSLVFGSPSNGLASRTPQCNPEQTCPNIEMAILTESAVSPVYRSKSNALDLKNCSSATGKIAGEGDTRACLSEADKGVFWTRDFGAYNDESACTAPCNIPGHAFVKWAYACARRVVTDSGAVEVVLVPDAECTAAGKPRPNPPACNQHKCVREYNWVAGPWTLQNSTMTREDLCADDYTVVRNVACYNAQGQVVDDSLCGDSKPSATQVIPKDTTCDDPKWLASAFSACSFTQGASATRSVDCVVKAADDTRYVKVGDDRCPANDKPASTTTCCLNGTPSTSGCKCDPGFFGVACELGGNLSLKVPSYQPYDNFRYFIDGALTDELKGNVELLRIQTNAAVLVARLKTNETIKVSDVLDYTPAPTSDPEDVYGDFFGSQFILQIAMGGARLESQPFVLNRPALCDHDGEYLFDEKRCQCPTDATFGGTFCHIDKCSRCDDTCHLDESGEVADCCTSGKEFSEIAQGCISPCAEKTCGTHGVAVEENGVCACECKASWTTESNCQMCGLQCNNGKADDDCAECVCNRGFTSENGGLCNCRSLVIRLAFKRTQPLSNVERASIAYDIAAILATQGVESNRVTVSAGTVQGSRLAVDISIKASSCFPSQTSAKDVKGMLARLKLSNWLKLDDDSDEFGVLAGLLADALGNPDELPSSFQLFEFDATLGASITDPACETDCMAPVFVGQGGPPLDDELGDGDSNDDLKWIIPISILIPLAVIVTGVILYIKCKPDVKTTSVGAQQIELEAMTE